MFSRILYPILAILIWGFASAAEDPSKDENPESLWELRPPPHSKDGKAAAEVIDLSPSSYDGPAVEGYKLILSGQINKDLTIGPEQSPVLISGLVMVPENCTLFVQAGSILHIRPDPHFQAEVKEDQTDPARTGQLWVFGSILADGLSGKAIEISGPPKSSAGIYLYGKQHSEFRGTVFKHLSMTQTAGSVQNIGSRWETCPFYAVASGGAVFLHCSFNQSGGVLTTTKNVPWGLMVQNCRFLECEDGIVLGSQPTAQNLLIERNEFLRTSGAHLRAWPISRGESNPSQSQRREFMVEENWYGTTIPEDIDAKIVDERSQTGIRARINIRPPAMQPYGDAGDTVANAMIVQAFHQSAKIRNTILALDRPTKIASKK